MAFARDRKAEMKIPLGGINRYYRRKKMIWTTLLETIQNEAARGEKKTEKTRKQEPQLPVKPYQVV